MSSTRNSELGSRNRGGPMTVDQGPLPATRDLKLSAADGIEELIGATAILRSELNVHEAICRKVLSEVRVDHEITGVLPEIHADTWRSAVTDAIRGFEAARHRVRLLLVAIEVEEGRSIGEVAKSWGVSRQLASRWVQESATIKD
jgi:hypothetical protein